MAKFKMSKKQAHIIIFLVDLFCIAIIWLFYNETRQLFSDMHNQADKVIVGSKEGFFIFAIVAPILHFVTIIEHFWFEFIKKHIRLISWGVFAMLILLFISAITISGLIKIKVENAGYVNCKELEWSGAYSVSYTYTRNQAICKQLVAQENKEK